MRFAHSLAAPVLVRVLSRTYFGHGSPLRTPHRAALAALVAEPGWVTDTPTEQPFREQFADVVYELVTQNPEHVLRFRRSDLQKHSIDVLRDLVNRNPSLVAQLLTRAPHGGAGVSSPHTPQGARGDEWLGDFLSVLDSEAPAPALRDFSKVEPFLARGDSTAIVPVLIGVLDVNHQAIAARAADMLSDLARLYPASRETILAHREQLAIFKAGQHIIQQIEAVRLGTGTGTTANPRPSDGPQATESNPNRQRQGKRPGVSPQRGKKLRTHLKNVLKKLHDAGPVGVKQAVTELKKLKRAKFDETVEIHINLGIDPAQSDQMVRGAIPLPHGIGKSVRVAVFAQGDNAAKARAAGADVVGGADLVEKIQKQNFLEFDVALASQDMMGLVSRLGKVLGPRGLMPAPKAGTVVPTTGDIARAVREFKAGKVEYRSDKSGQIHAGVGKMSFDDQKLVENINAFVEQVRSVKPSGVKGNFINGVVLSATMSPSIRLVV